MSEAPETGLDIYLVGGAVRDRLLGLPVRERDWVVVGSSPEHLKARGFKPVGREFPVFLHPDSGEEYALARTERKTGRGYHGFVFHAAPDVTLEQDLARRDLTINAMAEASDGSLVDPFGGRRDLAARRLRHVSPAFREDPVRILRLARFAARFRPLGFQVAQDTLALCQGMVEAGEADALVPERVWQELSRALMEAAPSAWIRVMRDCGALARVLPEVDRLFGVPQRPRYHPEVDTGEHLLLALDQAARLEAELPVRFAVLVHDLGKGVTPREVLPGHQGHEAAGVPLVQEVSDRLKVPRNCRELAVAVTRWHLHSHRALELRPSTLLKLLEALDAFRRPGRVDDFATACEADARGRTGLEEKPYPQAAFLRAARDAASAVDARRFTQEGLRGPEIAAALREARISALSELKGRWDRATDEHA